MLRPAAASVAIAVFTTLAPADGHVAASPIAATPVASHTCEHANPVPAWLRATSWAKRHAPKEYALLKPPATSAQVARLKAALPMHIPRNLLRWLGVNNGAGYASNLFPYDAYPLSVHQIIKSYRIGLSVNTKHYTAWRPKWIPILGDVYGDDEVLRAGRGDNSRCLYYYDFEEGPPGDFDHHGLKTMLHALGNWERAGETNDHWPLVVRHGRMHWRPPHHPHA
jgi:hypothetical protein